MNSKKSFILSMGLALALLFPFAGFAQSRTVEMVQPMPIGFRITDNLGFRQKDRYLYYWFRNSARYSDETLMQYDTRSRTRKKIFGPLGASEYQDNSVLSPSGKLLFFTSNSRVLLRKHKVKGKLGFYFLDTRTGNIESVVLSRPRGAACYEGINDRCVAPLGLTFSSDDRTFYYLTSHLIEAAPTLTAESLPALMAYEKATGTHTIVGERVARRNLFSGSGSPIEPDVTGQSVALQLRNRVTQMDDQLGEIEVEGASVLHPPGGAPLIGAPEGDGPYRYELQTGVLQAINVELEGFSKEQTNVSCTRYLPTRNQYFAIVSSIDPETFVTGKAGCFLLDLSSQETLPFACRALPDSFDGACFRYDVMASANGRYVLSRTGKKSRRELNRYDLTTGSSVVVTAPFVSTFHNGQYPPSYASMSASGAMVAFTDGSSSYVRGDSTVDDLFLVRIKN